MGHPPRLVRPGDLFHSFNRTIGHRTLVDDDVDGRGFLALIANLVHRDEIRVRSFCVMMTHFHILLESVNGCLGDAMQRLEGIYARGFNRRRPSRDGHLFRARYRLKKVVSQAYQSALIQYIDHNPVAAGLVADPFDYPFGSARLYRRTRGPAWLDRSWVESHVCRRLGRLEYSPDGYARCFGIKSPPGRRRWLEALMSSPSDDAPSLDELVNATPGYVLRWMDERAQDADGTLRSAPLCDAESIVTVLVGAEHRSPQWMVKPRRTRRAGWNILRVGLLRDLGGQTYSQVGARAEVGLSTAVALYAEHRHLLAVDEVYRTIAAETAAEAIRVCHDPRTL